MTINDTVYINGIVYRGKRGTMRKAISTKVRFEVFKRHSFKCYYCGVPGSKTELECDHLIPVAKGGTNDLHNLVPACAECNSGKRASLLSPQFQSKHAAAKLYADRISARNIFEEEIEETSDGRVRVSFHIDSVEALSLMRAVLVNEQRESISEMLLSKGRWGNSVASYGNAMYHIDSLYDEEDVLRNMSERDGSAIDRAYDELLRGRLGVSVRELADSRVRARFQDYVAHIKNGLRRTLDLRGSGTEKKMLQIRNKTADAS